MLVVSRLAFGTGQQGHSEIEQLAVEPSNMVPGIRPSPDKVILGRLFSYPDAHRYRIGANYNQLPVTRRWRRSTATARTGHAEHQGLRPGVRTELEGRPRGRLRPLRRADRLAYRRRDCAGRLDAPRRRDDWDQSATLSRDVMDDAQRDRLVSNIVGHLLEAVTEPGLDRTLEYWGKVDDDWACGSKTVFVLGSSERPLRCRCPTETSRGNV